MRRFPFLAVATLTLVGAFQPGSAAAVETEEPEKLIRQGLDLRRQGDNAKAHGYLKRAYDLAKTPRSAAQLGMCEQALGQFPEAEVHIGEALATKDPWVQSNRASLETSRSFVRARLGRVELLGAPGNATIATGTSAGITVTRDHVVWVAPGANTLLIEAAGYTSVTKTVTIRAGESISLPYEGKAVAASAGAGAAPTLQPPVSQTPPPASSAAASPAGEAAPAPSATPEATPAPAPSPAESPAPGAAPGDVGSGRTARLTGIAVAGAGLALGVTGFVLRGVASSKLEAIESDAGANRPYNDDNGNWQGFDRAGVGLILAGGAAVVTGAVLYFLNRNPDAAAESPKVTTVSLDIAPSGTGVIRFAGRF